MLFGVVVGIMGGRVISSAHPQQTLVYTTTGYFFVSFLMLSEIVSNEFATVVVMKLNVINKKFL